METIPWYKRNVTSIIILLLLLFAILGIGRAVNLLEEVQSDMHGLEARLQTIETKLVDISKSIKK